MRRFTASITLARLFIDSCRLLMAPPAYGHGQPAPPAVLHAPFAPPVTLPPNSEQHAFIDAAKRRDWPAVQRMVTESPSVINVMPNGRWSALHHAAYTGNVELVTWLLACGADAEALTPQGQWPRDVAPAGSECRRLRWLAVWLRLLCAGAA